MVTFVVEQLIEEVAIEECKVTGSEELYIETGKQCIKTGIQQRYHTECVACAVKIQALEEKL